jgi:hypothetical protein
MMQARLNDMAIARANMRKEHTLKLRVVQHKYAAQVALEHHARKLQRLHAKINAKAIAIAGADFADHHTLGFDSMNLLLRRSRQTMRPAALSKALESSMSSIWLTPCPIALIRRRRTKCRPRSRLNE